MSNTTLFRYRSVYSFLSLLISLLFLHQTVYSSVTISGGTSIAVLAGNPYSTLSSAIVALNGGGALTAPVYLDVTSGHTETLISKITMTISGTVTNPIVIQKSGIGANPKLFSYVGTNATPSATADGMFALVGCDYVTIDGIDLIESATNITPTTVMEFGYAFFKTNAINGAQNNTIKNCEISLNRIQNANWTTTGHTGSIGILMTNTTNTSNSAISITSISGTNSYNKFYSNMISNCNSGIAIVGFAAASPFTLADIGNDIGGTSVLTGNSILNYGGAASAANIASGIFVSNQIDLNCSYNTIQNNTGVGVNHTSILRGITLSGSIAANGNVNHNFINVKGSGTISEVAGISSITSSTALALALNLNHNYISGDYLTATTGYFYGIYVSGLNTINIINDSIHDINYSNQLNTGTGGGLNLILVTSAINATIRQNDIRDIIGTSLSGYTTSGIFSTASGIHKIQKNTLSNISISGFGTFSSMNGINMTTSASGSSLVDSNIISNLANNKTTGNGAMFGVLSSGTMTSETITNNTIMQLFNAGSGQTVGISSGASSSNRILSKNTIFAINSASITTVTGITTSGGGQAVSQNKVYDISGTFNGSPIVSGITISVGTSLSISLTNNLIGIIQAPNANTNSNGNPSVRGISLISTSSNSNNLITNNSVFLNASSVGTNFSSAGILHISSIGMPSTTSNLNLRNNLIYNASIPSGTGLAVAYQRGSANSSNYNSLSDRNLFYAGIPSFNHLIFTDTTSYIQTLSSYKTYMLPVGADQNSYDGDISFQSIVGSSNDFLKFDLLIPCLLESRGSLITGITNDYAGTIRAGNIGYAGLGSSPDIGAWELDGSVVGGCSGTPSISNALASNANPPCSSPMVTVSLDINYGLGIVFQWEESSTSGTSGFTPIVGSLNSTAIVNGLVTKWYRCVITCSATGQSVISTAVHVGQFPLSGTYLIDNTGAGNYLNFYQAISDLVCKGTSGAVIFNVTSGQIFNETNELNCTYSGTNMNTITFQKLGIGANPVVRRTGTINDTDAVLKLSGVDYYTFDGINFEQSGTSATNYVEYGIYLKAIAPNDGVRNNTLKNGIVSTTNNITTSRGIFMQRLFATIDEAGTNSQNRFVNMTVQQAMAGYYLSGMALDLKDHDNEISNEGVGQSIIQNLGSSTLNTSVVGIYTDEQNLFKLTNTEIKNLTCSSGSLINGISIGGDSSFIHLNSIHDITVPTGINCINVNPKTQTVISNNEVYNISCTAITGNPVVRGITTATTSIVNPDNGEISLSNNKIYDLGNNGNNSSQTIGIVVSKGQPLVYNNMISDLRAGNSGNGGGTSGILFASNALSTTECKLYYNTVYLSDSGANLQYVSAGINSPASIGSIDMRNNVIVNHTNISTGAIATAIFKSNSIDIISDSSNNNLYYAGVPSSKNFIYYDGTNSATTLNSYKSLSIISPAESNTDQENVFFQFSTNGFLRPNLSIPTKVEGNAQVISDIHLDFENELRNPVNPDRGADEGNFTPGLPPCLGQPIESTTISSPANPCPGAPFTLSLGTSFNLDFSFQWEESTSSVSSGYTAISGATNSTYLAMTTTNKWYRCIVTCNYSLQTKASIPEYVNLDLLSGVYLIDQTGVGNYLSFFEALSDLNCKGANGMVTFNVTAGQVFFESSNLICSYQGSSTNAITFKKVGTGNNPIIRRTGTLANADYMLRLNGADYINFDGIDFQQIGTSSSNYVEQGIHIVNASASNGASYNTFKNGVITLTNAVTASKGVNIQSVFTPTSSLGSNNKNRFINMTVQNSFQGYLIAGVSSGFPDDGNEIIRDTSLIPSAVSLIQNIGNSMINSYVTGVYVDFQTNFKCIGTEFTNIHSSGASIAIDGIRIATSTANTVTLTDNYLHHFNSVGSIQAINVDGGSNALINRNRISILTATTSSSNSVAVGIVVNSSTITSSISKNIIYEISHNGANGSQAIGISLGSGTHLVDNNMISGLYAPFSANSTGSVKGIFSNGGTIGSTTRIYHNTVYLDDIGNISGYTSAGFYSGSTVPNLDIRNNVIVNNCNVTLGTRAVAFWKTSTVDNIDNLSNNNLWYAGVPGPKNLIMYSSTFLFSTLALYKASPTISPAESNAVTENVIFDPIINGVLRPTSAVASLMESGGTPISIMTTDFENDNRNLGAPDRGADEGNFTPVLPFALPSCVNNYSPANNTVDICQYSSVNLSWNVPITGGPITLGYDIYFGTNTNPPFVINTLNTSYTVNTVLANTTYYWKVVPKNQTGATSGCVINSFTTSNTSITSVVPVTLCGQGIASPSVIGNGNFYWYDSAVNGNYVNYGNSYTNNFSSTTTYYVNAEGGNIFSSAGKKMPSEGATMSNTASTGLVFNATDYFTIKSIDIYAAYSGSIVVILQNPSTSAYQSVTVTVPAGSASSPKTIEVNLNVFPGSGWQLTANNFGLLSRDILDTGFPYQIGNLGSITSGLNGGVISSSYNYFYNWKIVQTTACLSPRVPVTVTVTPAPPLTITPASLSICQNTGSTNFTVTSPYPYSYFYWSPSSNFVGGNNIGATVAAYNGSTTTYTVTATNGVCTSTKTVTHTVHPIPQSSYTASNSPVCLGDTLKLYAINYSKNYYLDTSTIIPFIDISLSGTSVGVLSTNSEHNISVPTFIFNASSINQLRIGANGMILLNSITDEIPAFNYDLVTNIYGLSTSLLAPFWDALDVQVGSDILTKTQGDLFIIQYNNMKHQSMSSGSITFQVQINFITSEISFVYPDAEFGNSLYDFGNSATIGIQMDASNALKYSFNTSSLTNGKGIRFISESSLTSYAWTGPAGYTSTQHFPQLPNVTSANAGVYTVIATTSQGCTVSASIPVTVNNLSQQPTLFATSCGPFYWNLSGQTYTQSGIYKDTSNCVVNTLDVTIQNGTTTYDTITACNSYTWPLLGITYTTSGVYGAAYSYPYCDTVWLVLSILPSTSNIVSSTNCNSYTWPLNGLTYTQSGNYTATVGCQTTQLQLNIVNSNNTNTSISACDSYTWLANGITYTNSGTYFISSGCDTQFLNLIIQPSSFSSTSISACNYYTWPSNGITYANSGLYEVINGCDTQQLNLTINYGANSVQTISSFNNYFWSVSGLTYTNSGVYTSTNLNTFGCIDTFTLNLTILANGLVSMSVIQDQSVSCYGLNDGSCQAIGYPISNYIYTLDGGAQSNSTGFFGSLIPGIHTVCVSDGINSYCDTVTITQPDSLSIQFSIDSIVSCQGNDGALSIMISGGTNSLQGYLTWWINSNGDTVNNVLLNNFATSLSHLPSDDYQVVVEDDHGCFASQTTYLPNAQLLTVNASASNIVCNGGSTQILTAASGGVNYLSYTFTINGLPLNGNYVAGSYTVTAIDSKGCIASTTILLSDPELLSDTSLINACAPYEWNGNQYLSSGIYTNTFISMNGCDSLHTIILTINNGIRFSPKVLLSGCYESNGLMHDSLRATGQIPLTEPYTAMNFAPIGYTGGEMISSQQLALTGSNAIVDWVHIEVRSSSPTFNKIASMNALLQRDGDIVDVNGNSLYFPNICPGNYYISIKHRNHLGVMTALSVALDSTNQLVDFTNSNPVWVKPGVVNTPRKTVGSYSLLWAGDSRFNKNVKYVGLNNDKEPILYAVGNATINNILYPVYRTEDVNMDARVKYNNNDNDKNFILNQVLISNPLIPSPNAVTSQHTPN